MIWTKYCGTATKVGGNREYKRGPVVMGVSCLLENNEVTRSGKMENWVTGKISEAGYKFRDVQFGPSAVVQNKTDCNLLK